jgi:hypothetical protein
MQLKLLRRMQADLNERTSAAAMAGQNGGTPAEIDPSQESLAREQGRIAELARTLMEPLIEMQRTGDAAGEDADAAGGELEQTP